MTIQQQVSLKPYNSFGIDVLARELAFFSSAGELQELMSSAGSLPLFILGGGSNILFTRNLDARVLRNAIPGIELVREDDRHLYVRAGAGENWNDFVHYCVARGWSGVENLTLIPGLVGAGPMQNIGAYGVELKDVFEELEAFHLGDRKVYTLSANDCAFGYRDSIFKNRLKGQAVILTVTFRLNKIPVFHTGYAAVEAELETMGVKELSISAISQAVTNIRRSKLPDPAVTGNAGSFFKNPVISKTQFEKLKAEFPGLVAYENGDHSMKLAAGWLIEQCGWKGFRRGDAGVHARQALVLINYGQASGSEIYALSEEIQQSVKARFGVTLEREVNIV